MIRKLLPILILLLSSKSFAFEEEKCVPHVQKICIDEQEKIIDGFNVKQCWKYKEVFRCSSNELNHCDIFESNRGCREIYGKCLKESPTGLCSHYHKKFVCGSTVQANKEIKLISSAFNVIRDEKDLTGCDDSIKDKYCEIVEENCIEPSETRNINGKNVYKECWKWDRKYQCRTNSFVDDCKVLKDKGCREVKKECLHEEDGRCEHMNYQYECDETKQEKIDCIATKFCVGDVCREEEREKTKNFGLAASYLGVLSQMNKDQKSCGCNKEKDPDCHLQNIDESKCTLFKGEEKVCRRYTGEFNCCLDRGFIKKLFGCNGKEQDLHSKQRAGLCVHAGSWRGRGLERFKKRKAYCCFNSKMARIIQEQGRVQLGRGFGSFENPDCGPLTLSEIRRIDFSKIKFDELYAELKAKAKADFKLKNQEIENKIKSYQDNPKELKKLMQGRMEKFYVK